MVIDETSMLSGFLLRVLDRVARWWMGAENSAFGGLTMLFVGDALQLPPIEPSNAKDKDDDDNERAKGRTKKGQDFFFRAEEWQDGTWVQ